MVWFHFICPRHTGTIPLIHTWKLPSTAPVRPVGHWVAPLDQAGVQAFTQGLLGCGNEGRWSFFTFLTQIFFLQWLSAQKHTCQTVNLMLYHTPFFLRLEKSVKLKGIYTEQNIPTQDSALDYFFLAATLHKLQKIRYLVHHCIHISPKFNSNFY